MRRDLPALRLLHRSLAADPADAASWFALGVASLRANHPEEARIQFSRAAALLPSSAGAWHGLGWSCLLLQDTPAALTAFRQALGLDPESAESEGCVALALWLSGRREQAARHLARANQLDRRHLVGRYLRALQQGREILPLRSIPLFLLERRGLFGKGAPGVPKP
ncbi:MAG TPA: tetratricopeptide repeat protein [Ramlibacter sp.]|uniref:tetratricopeptide repeat protein n=1 Tax=Ramlibacter sp. TaxID=1917967 RepID=UPI002ED22BB6